MDIDQAKSATTTTEDQMEMMMMTMMFPELYDAVDHSSSSPPPPPFTNHNTTTNPCNNFPDHHHSHGHPPQPPYLHQLPPFNGNYNYNPNSDLQEPSPPPVLDFLQGTNNKLTLKSSSSMSASPSSMAAMREMIFRIAAMQPVHVDPEAVKPPKRRNVRISKDPQSVAARHRRERISERIRILQRLVPGGTKMDTASMLDEAIHYVKFLKTQVQSLERAGNNNNSNNNDSNNNNNNNNNSSCNSSSTNSSSGGGMGFPVAMATGASYFPMGRALHHVHEDFRDASG